MTQPSLPLTSAPVSFMERVAELFKSKPNTWLDGLEIAKVGGVYAYRTRISDCRRAPFSMTIENRQRKVGRVTVSEYRYVPLAISEHEAQNAQSVSRYGGPENSP